MLIYIATGNIVFLNQNDQRSTDEQHEDQKAHKLSTSLAETCKLYKIEYLCSVSEEIETLDYKE